ncbi:MAG: helix-turn-helix transcriptional regulator [Oscillospiraceae bacterium]|nr:helix-turn-helix transcriptional regulator [Oscillospiraceae bacterium]
MSTTVAARLVSLRKDKRISQKDAAKSLGVSQALLSHYENGIRECGLDFLCRASSFYDVSSDYLLGLSDTRIAADTLFDFSDIPQDRELRLNTIFRAAAVLLEKIGKSSNGSAENVRAVYLLTIYKIYVCAVNSGILPKDSRLHDGLVPFISSNMLDHALTGLKTDETAKPKKNVPLPLCLDTVVTESIKLIDEQIAAMYNGSKK